MRKQIWTTCIIVLAVCLWLLLHQTAPIISSSTEARTSLTNKQAASQQSIPPKNMTESQTANIPPSAETHHRPTLAEITNLQQRILEDWQAPIEFFGKVVDENTNPVAGASVTFKWVETPSEEGNRASETHSDSEGLFSLQKAKGPDLTVLVSKNGYYTSRLTPDSFRYSLGNEKFHANPLNPVIFHLRKKGKGESLIENNFPPGIGQIWQLHHDGTPIELDLLNGSQTVKGSGQLKLEFWRDISDMKKQPFDWKLQLSMPGGSLVPTDEEFAFQAPESGYQPSVVIDMPATNQPWMGEVRSKYYIQLSDGKYGRVDFYLLPRNGVFTIHSVINPAGLRNLEPK